MNASHLFNRKSFGILATLLIASIGLFSYQSPRVHADRIIVNIMDKRENNFINEGDIRDFIQHIGINNPGILQLESMNLRRLETELKSINFIREAQVARDLKGNLVVEVLQDTPMARIIPNKGQQAYLAENNTLLPLSEHYTARVMLLTGVGVDSLFSDTFRATAQAQELFSFIRYVNEHGFWKSQLTQFHLDEKLNIEAYPQVGKQVIEFGQAEGYEMKLRKLKTFYNEIVPKKGWNTYERVKLQYEQQIVCK